ncbi:MAG: CotH kinase family protein [Myxococcales bacterium]|nr:CotH kinase family protein [Myxococcales bacterium]
MNRALVFCCLALACACGPGEEFIPGNPQSSEVVEAPRNTPAIDRAAPVSALGVGFSSQAAPPPPFRMPALQADVPLYELEIPQVTMDLFAQDPYAPEQPATFRFQGATMPVMVELRGASARFFPKRSWNLDFHDLRFQGRRRVALIAEYQDCTMMAEKIAYDLLEAMEVEAPRARYVRVVINGKFEGVFLDLEKVDRRFLEAHHFADQDASIYRCGWKDCEMKTWKVPYQGNWKKKTNETEGDAALHEVLRAINHTPEPQLEAIWEARLELESLIRSMAMDALISNDYIEDSESYFIHDRVTGRWSYVPWDLNNVDARWWPSYGLTARPPTRHPLVIFSLTDGWLETMYNRRKDLYAGYLPVFSNLNTRVALNPALRQRLIRTTEKALDELFTPAEMHARIDATYSLITSYMREDPYIDQAKFAAGRQWMKDFVSLRVPFVRGELEKLKKMKPSLALSEVDAAQGWVELKNYGSAPVALDGKGVTTNLRKGLVRNLPSRTMKPGESVRFTASQLSVAFSEDGEVGLFNGVSVAGMIDALYLGKLPPGRHYARSAADPSVWEIR